MTTSIRITDHACKRIKERMGLNKKAAIRMVDIAYKSGIGKDNVKGQLYRYIELKSETYESGEKKIIIYGEMVYCFMDYDNVSVLITVYRIPNNLRNHITYQNRKSRAA